MAPKEATLPPILEKLVGHTVKLSRRQLRDYLKKARVGEVDLGGLLDDPLSSSRLPGNQLSESLYFVIHDTSSPYLGNDSFPSDMNSNASWKRNNLKQWLDQQVPHVYVNRLGNSVTTTKFSDPVKKGWGTKFARDVLKVDAKGMQIQIGLVQPRPRDSNDPNLKNGRTAPVPGFTEEQYQRLALLYICASLRRGQWMIPAFHSAIYAGIKAARDDPQNFDLESLAKQLTRLIHKIN